MTGSEGVDVEGGERGGLIGRIVAPFLEGPLAILLVIGALAAGLAAVAWTPREEEPQIVVPLADLFVRVPGASAEEVERLVATPLERHLWQVDGIEHVYSVSLRGLAIVSARFHVGEDRERSLVKLQTRVASHIDEAPGIVAGWVIKPVEIDDVPIVAITLVAEDPAALDDHDLRRIGEETLARLARLPGVSRTRIVGGRPAAVEVELDPERLAAHGLGPLEVERALSAADAAVAAGTFARADRLRAVALSSALEHADDVAELVVGVHAGRPVALRDVATVRAGPAEAASYARLGLGPADALAPNTPPRPAVTLAVSKKRGTNAVAVARSVLAEYAALERDVLPAGIESRVIRDQGRTADAKVDELLASLAFAMLSVVGLLLFTLGWREGLIVALAVPISFALALLVNALAGYTINRVTLFALILTLGLVVDDPITNVDNIQRHVLARRLPPRAATLRAVQEVLPPVLMSTLTVIVSFLPMFFITGMMGPYMEPMAVTVPITVVFSTVAALTVVPWAAHGLLRGRVRGAALESAGGLAPKSRRRLYARIVAPFLDSRAARWGLLALVLALLAGSGGLVVVGAVPLKMLPYADKDELLLVVDLPEGTSLETTDAALEDLEALLATFPEVESYASFAGTHGPIDFNGLVRRAYLRRAPNLGEIRVQLQPSAARELGSHELGLAWRRRLEAVAAGWNARLSIVESPPGPPVLATVVAEVHGPPEGEHAELLAAAELVRERMARQPGLVDVDVLGEDPRPRLDFVLDQEKAALHGIDARQVARALELALSGVEPASVHLPHERQPLSVRLVLPRERRSGSAELGRLALRGAQGDLVPLGELGRFEEVPEDLPIHHKDLRRVAFVVAETAGIAPADAVFALQAHFAAEPLAGGHTIDWAGEGEWDITIRVFRDLGLAFGIAMLAIYVLLVAQTRSFLMPLLVMTAIPLTAIGILPGFAVLNWIVDRPIDGFATPVFFTATAMIGMIALGGIVVRNSIVLIEFVQQARAEGTPLREAVLECGAVRLRPILLTAATTALGAWPITLDPIFSGLAWALIFGLLASTAFTLVVVPVTYYALHRARA